MILTVDIGNSNISFGGFSNDRLVFSSCISTSATMTSDECAAKLLGLFRFKLKTETKIRGAIIASVVPPLNSVMKQALRELFDIEPLVVGPGIKTGLSIHCDAPSSVGADLICAAVAARSKYPLPALIIDIGTATKMIRVSKDGVFDGVSIIPGVLMGLDALAEKTAQLPKISLDEPSAVIAKNTVEAMRSGAVFGNASMIDGMIDRICEESGADFTLIATGGLAQTVIPHCRHELIFDRHLVLEGLLGIYSKNN